MKSAFAFILCVNNEQYYEECLFYLKRLIVPVGYEVELLIIREATGITLAYNEAMTASNAKYKIYLHQDVFLLNPYFLQDILQVFESDHSIGMIGMVGYQRISPDGIMWHSRRSGTLYERNPSLSYPPLEEYRYSYLQDGVEDVSLIDGFLMATSVDLPWNTERVTGWDFYDAYQSLHFQEEGYRVVVPRQRHPWCLHDDGGVLNVSHYDGARRRFLQDYADCVGKVAGTVKHSAARETEEYFEALKTEYAAAEQATDEVGRALTQYCQTREDAIPKGMILFLEKGEGELAFRHIAKARKLLRICYILEIEHKYGLPCFAEGCESVESLMEKYNRVVFVLRRVSLCSWDEDKFQALHDLQGGAATASFVAVSIILQAELIRSDRELLTQLHRIYPEISVPD